MGRGGAPPGTMSRLHGPGWKVLVGGICLILGNALNQVMNFQTTPTQREKVVATRNGMPVASEGGAARAPAPGGLTPPVVGAVAPADEAAEPSRATAPEPWKARGVR